LGLIASVYRIGPDAQTDECLPALDVAKRRPFGQCSAWRLLLMAQTCYLTLLLPVSAKDRVSALAT